MSYTWSFKGEPHRGSLRLRDGGADFTDTFHASEPMACTNVADAWPLVNVLGTFSAGDGPRWGWRIALCFDPDDDELVLQMTVIKPHGEEGRAVRMIARRS